MDLHVAITTASTRVMFPLPKVIVSEVEDTPAEVVAKNPGPALLAAREAVVGGRLQSSDPHFPFHLLGSILMYILSVWSVYESFTMVHYSNWCSQCHWWKSMFSQPACPLSQCSASLPSFRVFFHVFVFLDAHLNWTCHDIRCKLSFATLTPHLWWIWIG